MSVEALVKTGSVAGMTSSFFGLDPESDFAQCYDGHSQVPVLAKASTDLSG